MIRYLTILGQNALILAGVLAYAGAVIVGCFVLGPVWTAGLTIVLLLIFLSTVQWLQKPVVNHERSER